MKTKNILPLLFVSMFVLNCAKEEAGTTAGSEGGAGGAVALTAAQIAGVAQSGCRTSSGFGAALDGTTSYMRVFNLGADLSFSMTTSFYTGLACYMGGTEIMAFYHSGTYTIDGLASAPAGTTKLTFTVTGIGTMGTVYATNPTGSTWAGYLNAGCNNGSPGFGGASNDVRNVSGKTCFKVSAPDFVFDLFPSFGDVYYNVVSLTGDSSTGTLTIGPETNSWMLGQYSSYPAACNSVYSYF